MDKTTKTILTIIGSVLVLCACAIGVVFATGLWSFGRLVSWTDQSVSENPEVAVRVGSEIADFEIPNGFDTPYSVHFDDISIVVYTSHSERSHILFAQFPIGTHINIDEMLRQISENANDPDNVSYNTDMTLIEQRPVTIRGQDCNLNISEGTSSEGIAYHSATATFEGRGGPSLVLIASPVDEWDIEMVDTFIASIQ